MPELAHQLRDVVVATDAYRKAIAEALGIGVPETAALGELLHRGPLTPSALVNRLGLTSPSVTSLLDRLELAGLATRRRHPLDRRSVLVELTEAGAAGIRATFEMFTEDIERPVRGCRPEHVQALATMLSEVAAALRDRASDRAGIADSLSAHRGRPATRPANTQ